jgi:hypothetical protein
MSKTSKFKITFANDYGANGTSAVATLVVELIHGSLTDFMSINVSVPDEHDDDHNKAALIAKARLLAGEFSVDY